jgi:adiponectin receptor
VHSEACCPLITRVEEAPRWLRQPFILHGYRICHTIIQSILSIFTWHNETVNIWTHLVPTILFILDGTFSLYKWRSGELSSMFALAKVIYPFCASITLGASSMFHTCNCVSQDFHKRLRTIDFVGISALIIGTTWSVMHYTFHCLNETWYLYTILLSVLSASALVVPIIPYFHRDVFRVFRVLLHCSVATGPFLMGLHAIRIWGVYSEIFTVLFSKIYLSYLSYTIGIVIYVLRIPERWFPGKVDLLGASHQIWHCFVVLGAHFVYSGLLDTIERPGLMTCAISEAWP